MCAALDETCVVEVLCACILVGLDKSPHTIGDTKSREKVVQELAVTFRSDWPCILKASGRAVDSMKLFLFCFLFLNLSKIK